MDDKSETMLVLGATGQQGGAVARASAADGRRVRALVRDERSAEAQALAHLGIELVPGDFREPTSLERAMAGVHGVFAALPSSADAQYGLTDEDEVRFGLAVGDAAKRAGVRHLVYSSTIGANPDIGLGHYASKWHIEQYLRRSGVPFTIVRPAPFMELLLYPHFGLRQGVLTFFGAPDQVVQFIAVADIGAIAAKLLPDPTHPLGVTMDIAGDALSGNDIAAAISRATGRQVPYLQIPIEAAAQNPMLARLLEAMSNGKLDGRADLPSLRASHPGLLSFDQWLAAGHAEEIRKLLPLLRAEVGFRSDRIRP
ncbi:NmrA/HSCARG family protein [Siculibacillus lacustris]|uniref:NmrA/HSCARG family protein n=1 Tax=Siculibacillus lacustris TaxID=1549641 RepID=A0A4Q9VNZ5_9HYPH|nr:NmrA/HSCARG family protein [Siculibacillus lacustris]TBW37423.1 NmrA/HSCARG family protein [Siculibacillus lacustris]